MVRGQKVRVDRTGREGGLDHFVLDVPPDADQVRTTRLFAASVARLYGVNEERVEDLKISVSEAVTNAIKAHRNGRLADPVRVTATLDHVGLRFTIVDAGPGFDAGKTMDAAEPITPPPGFFEGSLGLIVIRALFPDVTIERNADRGMTVSFRVQTGDGSAG